MLFAGNTLRCACCETGSRSGRVSVKFTLKQKSCTLSNSNATLECFLDRLRLYSSAAECSDELNFDLLFDHAALVSFGEESRNRCATFITIINSHFVDVHADELVSQFWWHVAGKLE